MRKASIGAAAAGALAATAPLLGRTRPSAQPQPEPAAGTPAAVPGPVVAHVHNLASGEVHVYSGTQKVVVTSHALANQITQAAAS